jgi:hypothetical protein
VYLDRQQLQPATVWVKRLKANLLNHRDKSCKAWCSEMEEEIRESTTNNPENPLHPVKKSERS